MLIDEYSAELNGLTRYLLDHGLLNGYNQPYMHNPSQGVRELKAGYWPRAPRMLGNLAYAELHESLTSTGCFDLQFLDGALMLFRYEFNAGGRGELRRSNVSFLPSPDLTLFQEDPDLYLADEIYGDVVDQRSVTVPMRFDYDSRPDVVEDLHHPVSHLTLGAYKHCRIPLTAGASPFFVIEFILRAFYRTPERSWTLDLPAPRTSSPRATITDLEQTYMHVAVPTA